ncbi:hypothetical protein BVX98_01005 [bacterium F11]|nr:hypothetical protein BVX98_01005 [bacterium F11]
MNSFGIMQSLQSWYGISIMGILALLSIYMVALMLVRFGFFRRVQVDSQKIVEKTNNAILQKDTKSLEELRGQRASDPPVRILVSTGISNAKLDPSELLDLFHVTRIRQNERLTKGLSIFGTIATIAPFLGLLGTVMGIVESFHNLAETGAAGPNVVASGVASALWTTAAGLVVAIPAVVAYNIFRNKAKRIMTDMEVVSRELILLFKANKVPELKASHGSGKSS